MNGKKMLTIASGIVTVLLLVLNWTGTNTLCQWIGQDTLCMGYLYGIIILLFPVIPLFLLSLTTYKMREGVYQTWFRFARWWVPLSMLLIFLAPEYSHDWMFSYEKGTVAFFSSLIFVLVSLILVIWKYVAVRKSSAL